jgi:protein-disulfide isomerase
MEAAEAAMEAFAQRGLPGFWAMHDLLFEHQSSLERADLEELAGIVGLDLRRFRRALDADTHHEAIESDIALAESLGATGTPSFYFNGRWMRGAQPFEVFQTMVDAALAEARAEVASGTPRSEVYAALTRGGATSLVWTEEAVPPDPDADRVYDLPVPARAPSRGAASARVVVQIFSDFQCPFCARVAPTVDALVERFGDRVRFVWRNYPLPFHIHAADAAAAAMEAFAQRGDAGFWAMHDLLFENQRDLGRDDLERYAAAIGLDVARFRRALELGWHDAEVEADMAAVREAGASIGTPSFFIGGRLVQGAQPLDVFVTAIERALAEAH